MKSIHSSSEKGFTLIEMIVSVGLFAVVMVICVATLLALVNANRKAQALQSVMNNLNIALDDMARNIRMGTEFYCAVSTPPSADSVSDCPNGTSRFEFLPYGGKKGTPTDHWVYWYNASTKQIMKSTTGDGTTAGSVAITSPEISIDTLNFFVTGSTPLDLFQPRAVIEIKGSTLGGDVRTKTTFHIQVTAVQRLIDL